MAAASASVNPEASAGFLRRRVIVSRTVIMVRTAGGWKESSGGAAQIHQAGAPGRDHRDSQACCCEGLNSHILMRHSVLMSGRRQKKLEAVPYGEPQPKVSA